MKIRRIIDPQPIRQHDIEKDELGNIKAESFYWSWKGKHVPAPKKFFAQCPIGKIGDVIHVSAKITEITAEFDTVNEQWHWVVNVEEAVK